MKQNLMQMQLKLSTTKKPSRFSQTEKIDFTSKAYFVSCELSQTQYAFSKKALSSYLHGKMINLQQKDNERPPKGLKGYMHFHQLDDIEQMIEAMIDLNVLKEEKIILSQRLTKRIFVSKRYEWKEFPLVLIKTSPRKSTSISNKQIRQNIKDDKGKEKSRLSRFLVNKIVLPVNLQKKQHQLKMKTEKERLNEEEKIKKIEEQQRLQKQKQLRQIQLMKQRQEEMSKKEQQKTKHQAQMNNFWLNQRQKIQSFVTPSNKAQLFASPNPRKNNNSQNSKKEQSEIQMAGNILQMQMKQLKEKQQERKNPIKPLISWSFMKNTLGIDGSQSRNDKESIPTIASVRKNQVKAEKSNKKSSNQEMHKGSFMKQNKSFETKTKEKQSESFQNFTPYMGRKSVSKVEVEQAQLQEDLNSESTQVTTTNYRLHKTNKNKLLKEEQPVQNKQIFAKTPKQSMFFTSYYNKGRRTTQTVVNQQDQKQKNSLDFEELNHYNNHKENFTFKRRTTVTIPEETLTVTKKPPSRTSSFEELARVLNKSDKQIHKEFSKAKITALNLNQQQEQILHTMTLALPKKLIQRKPTHELMRKTSNHSPAIFQTEIFSQTMTTPQPRTKHKKIDTRDLYSHAKTQYEYNQLQRDSFVEELIAQYYKRK